MGWASSLVSPPDGDLTDFMASCEKLRARDWRVFYPGHGAPIADPHARLDWLVAHRRAREAAILDALAGRGRPRRRRWRARSTPKLQRPSGGRDTQRSGASG